MHRLWFVVPAHGREALTKICLTQLRRTCDALVEQNIEASAVVVGDDENLNVAHELGFGTVVRDNEYLSRRFNDGIELACSPRYNPRPAEYVVPFGSDDWVDPSIFSYLPGEHSVIGFQKASFVDETGTHLAPRHIDYQGGVGIRIYPAALMKRLEYRPADEDRKRGCDTSILVNLKRTYQRDARSLNVVYNDQHDYQIVDWKSPSEQLNSYSDVANRFHGDAPLDPFEALSDTYPAEALDAMRSHYRG